jgi:hypothetical protein
MRSPLERSFFTLLLAMAGCGEVTTRPPLPRPDGASPGHDAGHDARREATADAISDVVPPDACPTSLPRAGARCALSLYSACEYGSDPEPECDWFAGCVDGGWTLSGPEDAGCETTNSPSCPATLSEITPEGACAVDASALAGVECYYPEARCWCSQGTFPATWQCDLTMTPGCPEPRPRIGTPCDASDAALLCRYPLCLAQVCRSGSWENYPICEKK